MIRTRRGEAPITFPDWLALSRVILVPVIMALTVGEGDTSRLLVAPCILFTIAAVTDFFDGYFARRWNMTSTLGAFLDTTADKLLVTGSLLALIAIDRVSIWAALIIVMREFVVMALRGLVALGGGLVRPSTWGKIKAVAQFVAIGFAFIRFGDRIVGLYFDQWLMVVAVVLTVVSAWQYLAGFWGTVRAARSGASA
jgi:CDP-diacylglycerol--glycerol-3-phosphate 3-phosphatidyltransferase